MAKRIEFDLIHGFPVGDERLKHVVMREWETGDLMDAQEQAEQMVLVPTQDGDVRPELVVSAVRSDVILLGSQIVKVDDRSGPFTPRDMRLFHKEDYSLLLKKAEELDALSDAESRKLTEAAEQRGRTEADQ